jgi:putative Mg2+ transporter-C (MgtC) family protein
MAIEQQFVVTLQLILAVILSMVIGIDREKRDKDAGLRTHILVGVGACLFTALSLAAFPEADKSRVAANVVTGVGFIGAGVIYRSESKIHDLTTAASIWLTAAIGMAIGAGSWFLAITGTLLVWFVLHVLWYVRRYL